jgi:ribosome-binding protein aMBF1 (putative translation factor)
MKKSLLQQYKELVNFRKRSLFESKEIMKSLCKEMRMRRMDKGIKLSFVAKKLKKSPSLLSQIEYGDVFPDEEIVKFYDSL